MAKGLGLRPEPRALRLRRLPPESARDVYLAALVVYGKLFKSPLLSPALQPGGTSSRTARTLQASAALSLGRHVPAARRCGKA